MAKFVPVEPFNLVIFGGTGDLSRRKLLPALFHRYLDDQIRGDTRIIATARSEMSDEDFVEMAREACRASTSDDLWTDDAWSYFSEMLSYAPLDIAAPPEEWNNLADKVGKSDHTVIYYLATSPSLYVKTCGGLEAAGMVNENCRVVLEKPIGHDLSFFYSYR